jgi:hypothetical protein
LRYCNDSADEAQLAAGSIDMAVYTLSSVVGLVLSSTGFVSPWDSYAVGSTYFIAAATCSPEGFSSIRHCSHIPANRFIFAHVAIAAVAIHDCVPCTRVDPIVCRPPLKPAMLTSVMSTVLHCIETAARKSTVKCSYVTSPNPRGESRTSLPCERAPINQLQTGKTTWELGKLPGKSRLGR